MDELFQLIDSVRMLCEEAHDTYMPDDFVMVLNHLQRILDPQISAPYIEFLKDFKFFCGKCSKKRFFDENRELFDSAVDTFTHVLLEIEACYRENMRKCPICGRDVVYMPISNYYEYRERKYHTVPMEMETLNKVRHRCPVCGGVDRERMIVTFLNDIGLQTMNGIKLLQFAPSAVLEQWIKTNCPKTVYESTDLCMEGVTFQADIQDMYMVEDDSYDIIICSHVLEHVEDDKKALRELRRILKPDGMILFLVPVDLSCEGIDEAWGLSEEENWKRFGQGDHCRRYGKQAMLQRIENEGLSVNEMTRDYFGKNVFDLLQLTDTSTLYVLKK